MKIFTYGTLKYNQPNHHILRGKSVRIAENAIMRNMKLYDLGAFPAAVMAPVSEDDFIVGEIYDLHHDKEEFTVSSLDRLEGHPYLYERQVRQCVDEQGNHHEVNVYVYLHSVQGYRLMPDGKWGN